MDNSIGRGIRAEKKKSINQDQLAKRMLQRMLEGFLKFKVNKAGVVTIVL